MKTSKDVCEALERIYITVHNRSDIQEVKCKGVSVIPEFHRLNKSRTVEMSKEELREKLREETERSQKRSSARKPVTNSRKQQKIAETARKQLPPQSPARKKREAELKKQQEQEQRAKQRQRKRGGSNIVYYVMLFALAAIIFAVLSVTVLFNTEKIIVEGESDYTDEQIIAASGLEGNENLVRLSLTGLPERMLDKLVTLDNVKVEKVFPSTIKITVERSVPMACFMYAGQSYVISHIGRVMSMDEREADCMRILGYKPADSVIVGGFIKAEDEEQDKLVKEISTAVEKAGIEDITTVNITDNLAIILSYQDRVEINIGSVLDIDQKMRIINELLFNGHIAETEHVTLDVSDTSRAIQRPITSAPIVVPEETEDTEEGEEGEGAETTENDGETPANA
ncbi:MAG: FtsQ-type POTRA domain-containing protein [Ruminiclostridium sp.]|nr:FtsQ-type POTRA domain-containing protein [Ruminiclostridium sp.]